MHDSDWWAQHVCIWWICGMGRCWLQASQRVNERKHSITQHSEKLSTWQLKVGGKAGWRESNNFSSAVSPDTNGSQKTVWSWNRMESQDLSRSVLHHKCSWTSIPGSTRHRFCSASMVASPSMGDIPMTPRWTLRMFRPWRKAMCCLWIGALAHDKNSMEFPKRFRKAIEIKFNPMLDSHVSDFSIFLGRTIQYL